MKKFGTPGRPGVQPLNNWIAYQYREGMPVALDRVIMTPLSRAFIIQIPGLKGGLVWNRPAGVRLNHLDGTEEYVPIRDVTRLTIFGIAGLSLLAAILVRVLIGKDSK